MLRYFTQKLGLKSRPHKKIAAEYYFAAIKNFSISLLLLLAIKLRPMLQNKNNFHHPKRKTHKTQPPVVSLTSLEPLYWSHNE
jgi:hypothetical protein